MAIFYLKKPADTTEMYFLSLGLQHTCMHVFADFYLYPTPNFSQDKCTSLVTQQFTYSGRKKIKSKYCLPQ